MLLLRHLNSWFNNVFQKSPTNIDIVGSFFNFVDYIKNIAKRNRDQD